MFVVQLFEVLSVKACNSSDFPLKRKIIKIMAWKYKNLL